MGHDSWHRIINGNKSYYCGNIGTHYVRNFLYVDKPMGAHGWAEFRTLAHGLGWATDLEPSPSWAGPVEH